MVCTVQVPRKSAPYFVSLDGIGRADRLSPMLSPPLRGFQTWRPMRTAVGSGRKRIDALGRNPAASLGTAPAGTGKDMRPRVGVGIFGTRQQRHIKARWHIGRVPHKCNLESRNDAPSGERGICQAPIPPLRTINGCCAVRDAARQTWAEFSLSSRGPRRPCRRPCCDARRGHGGRRDEIYLRPTRAALSGFL